MPSIYMQADGRTNGQEEVIGDFCDYANAPEVMISQAV
jgi:hypothetical protein